MTKIFLGNFLVFDLKGRFLKKKFPEKSINLEYSPKS